MALAPLLYNITFDSQTRILYFWDKAGHEIYHCEIPSPAPALPTVEKTDSWEEGGAYNWCYNSSQGSAGTTLVSIASNASSLLYFEDGSPIPYDSTKAYGPIFWKSDNDTTNNFGCVIVNDSGYLAIKNITSSTITFQSCRCAVCSSNSVENITVYDSNNQPYFAWLFVSNGTNYYFVLRTETNWTDDLSSIGYHVPPALPTVSTTWLVITAGEGNFNIPANGQHVGYWWDDDSQSYVSAVWNSGVTYGMIAFYTTPFAYAGRMELEIKEVSGTVGVHNVSNSSVTVCQANIAVCSSNLATVITVYDSSNNPYNAFKYTLDGTDYYYVLDGTQTDWTDDLSGIGYHLPPAVLTAWFTDQGSTSTSNYAYSGTARLYDPSGALLLYDSTKTYSLVKAYVRVSGQVLEQAITGCYLTEQDSSLHTLGMFSNEARSYYYIEYTVS